MTFGTGENANERSLSADGPEELHRVQATLKKPACGRNPVTLVAPLKREEGRIAVATLGLLDVVLRK
jgi:hypothetical protein